MPPDNHYLPLLLPVLLSASLFLVIVVVFIVILVVLLRKLQKLQNLQKVQAAQLQAVHSVHPVHPVYPVYQQPQQYQQQAPFIPAPSMRAPAQSVPAQQGGLPVPEASQGVQGAMRQNSLLDDRRWLSLVEDNIGIYDELDRHMEDFDGQRRQLAEHVLLRLEEILARSGVSFIQGETAFDRHRHQPVPASVGVAPGAPILETLRPGFAVDGRVLRRARVRA